MILATSISYALAAYLSRSLRHRTWASWNRRFALLRPSLLQPRMEIDVEGTKTVCETWQFCYLFRQFKPGFTSLTLFVWQALVGVKTKVGVMTVAVVMRLVGVEITPGEVMVRPVGVEITPGAEMVHPVGVEIAPGAKIVHLVGGMTAPGAEE